MKVNQALKQLDTVEMMKCDGCDGYHPVAECEVVIIRVIKGKSCEITPLYTTRLKNVVENTNKQDGRMHIDVIKPSFLDNKVEVNINDVLKDAVGVIGDAKILPTGEIADADGIGRHIPPQEMEQINLKKKSIIPPEFRGLTVSPASPNFESAGNKVIRHV